MALAGERAKARGAAASGRAASCEPRASKWPCLALGRPSKVGASKRADTCKLWAWSCPQPWQRSSRPEAACPPLARLALAAQQSLRPPCPSPGWLHPLALAKGQTPVLLPVWLRRQASQLPKMTPLVATIFGENCNPNPNRNFETIDLAPWRGRR